MGGKGGSDAGQGGRVSRRLYAPERETEPLFGEAALHGRATRQDLGQLDRVRESVGRTVEDDAAARVHGQLVVERAVAPDTVVVLEGVAERIHQRVAALGAGVLVVLAEALARRTASA